MMKLNRLKIIIIPIMVFLVFESLVNTGNISAQELKKQRGYKGKISKKDFLTQIEAVQDKKDTYVDGYVIKGDDLIEIIQETDYEIKISDSIIERGLDFTKLPAEPPEKVKLPKDWDEKERQAFTKKSASNPHIVTNKISIFNSEIRSETPAPGSIRAKNTIFHKMISFKGTTFNNEANFSGTIFSGRVDFDKAIFSGGVGFYKATFSGEAGFDKAIFSGWAGFLGATFSGWADFYGAIFGGRVDFSKATFIDEASFKKATFSGEANFSGATFSGWAGFDKAIFSGRANFPGVTFSGGAHFFGVTFNAWAHFPGATFSGETDFLGVTFSSGAYFPGAIFSRGASFSSVTFSGGAHFSGTTFSGKANFYKAIFSGRADFFRVTFSGRADFDKAIFNKLAYFKEARFNKTLLLRFANIKIYADFRKTEISKLNFNDQENPTILEGRIDFREAVISEAHFQDIIFEKDVDFSDVKFGVPGKASAVLFRFVTFESDTSFARTEFSSDTAFERIVFKKDANFTDANFKDKKGNSVQKFSLSYLNFKSLQIKWEQLPNPESWVSGSKERIKSFSDIEKERNKQKKKRETLEPLSQLLKSLEANFRSLGQLSDANIAYYHMKNAELKEDRKQEDGSEKAIWQWLPTQAPWIVWGLTCGYGTKIYRILGWCILFDLLFAIIFSIKGNLKRQAPPKAKEEFSFKQRLFDFPRLYLTEYILGRKSRSVDKFINAWRFSSVILFKVGYRDTTISGKIIGIDYKYIVRAEWLLGFYLLASLAVTLSNTLPIVNRLITGVF